MNNVENFCKGREKIIEGFKNGVFPVYYGNHDRFSEDEDDDEEDEEEQKEESEESKFFKNIKNKSEGIGYLLFNYFNFKQPSDLAQTLFEIKDKKNDDFVEEIKNRQSNLKDSIEKTPRDEKDNEKIEKILEVVKDILKFNEQNQQGEGIKILTPNQMLNRLPIALVQLQAENNSNKLKNEVRQLLYSLYLSKNMTEQVYKSLIGII